jgi:hypothetical protein
MRPSVGIALFAISVMNSPTASLISSSDAGTVGCDAV